MAPDERWWIDARRLPCTGGGPEPPPGADAERSGAPQPRSDPVAQLLQDQLWEVQEEARCLREAVDAVGLT